MKKIKILEITAEENREYETFISLDAATAWEEVSDDEYTELLHWCDVKNTKSPYGYNRRRFVMVAEYKEPHTICLEEIRQIVEKEKEQEKKKKEAAKKAKATRKVTALKKKKEMLEKIKGEIKKLEK